MDASLKHFKQKKEIYFKIKIKNKKMLHSIEMNWYLLNKYYQKIDKILIYVTILFFNFQKQTTYFKQNWPNNWYYFSLERTNNIFNNYYKHIVLFNVN